MSVCAHCGVERQNCKPGGQWYDVCPLSPTGGGHAWNESERTYTRDEIIAMLVIRPCHVTGMHEPDHHLKYTCDIQRTEALRNLLKALDVNEGTLPHDLHDEGTCYWCHTIPNQEEYRSRLRKTWEWAGKKISSALAQPAPDAPEFDVSKSKVLSTVKKLSGKGTRDTEKDGWVHYDSIRKALDLSRHSGKFQRPLQALVDEGKLEFSNDVHRGYTGHARPKQ
jgi:hypothetical protein